MDSERMTSGQGPPCRVQIPWGCWSMGNFKRINSQLSIAQCISSYNPKANGPENIAGREAVLNWFSSPPPVSTQLTRWSFHPPLNPLRWRTRGDGHLSLQSLPMSDDSLGYLSTEISVHFTLISSLITGGSVFSCPSPRTAPCVTSYTLGLLCSQIDFHLAVSGLQSIWKFWKILALVWSKMVSKTTL